MKNKYLYIATAIFFLLPLSGMAQAAQEIKPSSYQKLEQDFLLEEISESQLSAFQEKGIEKLNEFVSYINLMADKSEEQVFQEQIIAMTKDLFLSDEVEIKSYNETTEKFESSNLTIFLQKLVSAATPSSVTTIDEINILDNPERPTTWRLNFKQLQTKADKKLPPVMITISVVLKKVTKRFGETEKEIWKVFLGDMESINFSL